MAMNAGAAALGLVSRMPSGPGVIDEDTIAEIAASAPPHVATFLLTSERTSEAIAAQVERTGVDTVQIVDHVPSTVLCELRLALPRLRLVQVVHVEDERAIDLAREAAPLADALLLDSGSPTAGVLGGTGRAHDWQISRRIVESVSSPVFLAGGLSPNNVREAVDRVKPAGLDVCSGLRRDGRLDAALLDALRSSVELRPPPLFRASDTRR